MPGTASADRDALDIALALADAAHSATSLGAALSRVGTLLQAHLGTRGMVRLRLEGWNGENALVRPWGETTTGGMDHIDVSSLGTVHRDDAPIGWAITRQVAVICELPASPHHETHAWRPRRVHRVIAVPVVVDGVPQAVLEMYDPVRQPPQLPQLLELARIQLCAAAQREANKARIATSTEHLGRLALVASRIASGVAITDHNGTIEWFNRALLDLTGWTSERVKGATLCELLSHDAASSSADKLFASNTPPAARPPRVLKATGARSTPSRCSTKPTTAGNSSASSPTSRNASSASASATWNGSSSKH